MEFGNMYRETKKQEKVKTMYEGGGTPTHGDSTYVQIFLGKGFGLKIRKRFYCRLLNRILFNYKN